ATSPRTRRSRSATSRTCTPSASGRPAIRTSSPAPVPRARSRRKETREFGGDQGPRSLRWARPRCLDGRRPADNQETMAIQENPRRWDISTAALVVANATPLFCVLVLHWQVFPLLLLYWLENVVVGIFNVLRMAVADPHDPGSWIGKLFMIPFFCVHYGMFCFVHGIFVFALFGGAKFGEPF